MFKGKNWVRIKGTLLLFYIVLLIIYFPTDPLNRFMSISYVVASLIVLLLESSELWKKEV